MRAPLTFVGNASWVRTSEIESVHIMTSAGGVPPELVEIHMRSGETVMTDADIADVLAVIAETEVVTMPAVDEHDEDDEPEPEPTLEPTPEPEPESIAELKTHPDEDVTPRSRSEIPADDTGQRRYIRIRPNPAKE